MAHNMIVPLFNPGTILSDAFENFGTFVDGQSPGVAVDRLR